jgi:hypothetical protein
VEAQGQFRVRRSIEGEWMGFFPAGSGVAEEVGDGVEFPF